MKPRAEELKEVAIGEMKEFLPLAWRNRAGTRTDFTTSLLFAGAALLFVVFVVKKILR